MPDYSKLKVYSHNESNKYILCVMIANQIALAQIDSGSHYTVISSGLHIGEIPIKFSCKFLICVNFLMNYTSFKKFT